MTEAIIYDSLTGNTEILAKEIKKERRNAYIEKINNHIIEEIPESELYYIGTPIIKGMCTEKMKKFLQKLENKKIFLFVTAGFGGSDEYYETLKNRIIDIIPKNNQVVGTFFCQGKMNDTVKERYIELIKEHPEDKNLKVSLENFELAKSHPNKMDKDNLITEINKIGLN